MGLLLAIAASVWGAFRCFSARVLGLARELDHFDFPLIAPRRFGKDDGKMGLKIALARPGAGPRAIHGGGPVRKADRRSIPEMLNRETQVRGL
jgi:hypothetical protein